MQWSEHYRPFLCVLLLWVAIRKTPLHNAILIIQPLETPYQTVIIFEDRHLHIRLRIRRQVYTHLHG